MSRRVFLDQRSFEEALRRRFLLQLDHTSSAAARRQLWHAVRRWQLARQAKL